MKHLTRALEVLNDILDAGLVILLTGVLAISSYTVYDSYMLYRAADSSALIRYKPGNEEKEEDKALLDCCVAWLSVENTMIDFPVMQGETNEEFLNKDPFGEYSLAGSIFIDSRNSPQLTDEYLIVYGHHMSGDAMFGTLDHYLEKGYAESHSEGALIREDGAEYPFHLFAVVDTTAEDPLIFNPEHFDRDKILRHARERAQYFDEAAVRSGQILALTTCKYPNTTQRTVVLGYLFSPEGEREQTGG